MLHLGKQSTQPQVNLVLFCSLAVIDPSVGHTMDVLSPFISDLCNSDWLFHRDSCQQMFTLVFPGVVFALLWVPSFSSYFWHFISESITIQADHIQCPQGYWLTDCYGQGMDIRGQLLVTAYTYPTSASYEQSTSLARRHHRTSIVNAAGNIRYRLCGIVHPLKNVSVSDMVNSLELEHTDRETEKNRRHQKKLECLQLMCQCPHTTVAESCAVLTLALPISRFWV